MSRHFHYFHELQQHTFLWISNPATLGVVVCCANFVSNTRMRTAGLDNTTWTMFSNDGRFTYVAVSFEFPRPTGNPARYENTQKLSRAIRFTTTLFVRHILGATSVSAVSGNSRSREQRRGKRKNLWDGFVRVIRYRFVKNVPVENNVSDVSNALQIKCRCYLFKLAELIYFQVKYESKKEKIYEYITSYYACAIRFGANDLDRADRYGSAGGGKL